MKNPAKKQVPGQKAGRTGNKTSRVSRSAASAGKRSAGSRKVPVRKKSAGGKKAAPTRPHNKASGAPESPAATVTPEAKQTAETRIPESFPIVGIGASAGGLEALETFFKAMPVPNGAGFVVAVHLDPTHISILPELLQRHTRMPVCQIKDGMVVEPDHLYVIPPNKNLTILHGKLYLIDLVQPRGVNLPIDSFFRSLARDQNHNAICIILSGTGTDGTLAVKAIKGEAGMVMVQDEGSAKYDGMPRSAIATGLVDYVLPPEKMPGQLISYARQSVSRSGAIGIAEGGEGIHPSLQKIFIILRDRTGHDFSRYKENTICRRIERRMNVHQIDNIAEYVRYLQRSDREAGILFKELLIGVTNFFRDPEAFHILQTEVLPDLLDKRPDDSAFRVWIPACASGEEAYSVAILLHESMERIGRRLHIQIFGTDIDEAAVEASRSGRYPESILADVEPDRIKRYFDQEMNGQYRVKKLIREMLVFAPQDVIKDPPFTKLDLICCRNLLIYLTTELQKNLLPLFHYSLKPDGILFLGSSETIGTDTDLFTPLNRKWKIFRRQPAAERVYPVLNFPLHSESGADRYPQVPKTVQLAEELSTLQIIETILRQTDIPPCAIINAAGNAVYIHGRTGKFLEPAEGKASVNIVEMARPGLKDALSTAIRQVAADGGKKVRQGLQINSNGVKLYLNITVKPILKGTSMRGLMMVVFEETESPPDRNKPAPKPLPAKSKVKSIEALEDELRSTKEMLEGTIEQAATSNEEFQSANEELQSTNEELQSMNEELVTSKEELQSLNEEASTVNAELQSRINELSITTDDMKNLLNSTKIATIFLDIEMRIRLFTPRATEIIPLTAADAGRPIEQLASSLRGIDLAECGRKVLEDLAVLELEAESTDGRNYTIRVRPYRTTANLIDGIVITLEENTARKQAEQLVTEAREYADDIINTLREPFLVLDNDLRVVSAGRSFYSTFRVSPEETVGRFVYDLGNGQWNIPPLRELLEEILPKKTTFDNYRVKHKFESIGEKILLINARELKQKSGKTRRILLSMEDVTKQRPDQE